MLGLIVSPGALVNKEIVPVKPPCLVTVAMKLAATLGGVSIELGVTARVKSWVFWKLAPWVVSKSRGLAGLPFDMVTQTLVWLVPVQPVLKLRLVPGVAFTTVYCALKRSPVPEVVPPVCEMAA